MDEKIFKVFTITPWWPCFYTYQHGLKESDRGSLKEHYTKLFEYRPTSFGGQLRLFLSLTMETRPLHASKVSTGFQPVELRQGACGKMGFYLQTIEWVTVMSSQLYHFIGKNGTKDHIKKTFSHIQKICSIQLWNHMI